VAGYINPILFVHARARARRALQPQPWPQRDYQRKPWTCLARDLVSFCILSPSSSLSLSRNTPLSLLRERSSPTTLTVTTASKRFRTTTPTRPPSPR
jgi:hypothetical protein